MTLETRQQGTGWDGWCQAFLKNVNLASATSSLSSQMRGDAVLSLSCDIKSGKISTVDGWLRAVNGQIDPVWLALVGSQIKQPLTFTQAFARFDIRDEVVSINEAQIESSDIQEATTMQSIGYGLQDVVHYLTSPLNDQVAGVQDQPLNNQGIELLRHFQLSQPIQTARLPLETGHH
jgi:hypothetical protein